MSASFEEKSVWIQLAAMTLGLGAYLFVAGQMLANGQRAMAPFAAVFMVAVVAMVIFMIVAFVIAAITGRPEGRDERDRLIAWRSEHNSSWIIATGVLGAVTCMVLGIENVWTANLLLLTLGFSEILGFTLRIVYYRRGV